MLSGFVDLKLQSDIEYLLNYFLWYAIAFFAMAYIIEHITFGKQHAAIPHPLDLEVMQKED